MQKSYLSHILHVLRPTFLVLARHFPLLPIIMNKIIMTIIIDTSEVKRKVVFGCDALITAEE